MCRCLCACAQLCLTLCDTWTIACQAPLSMEFSRQAHWSGLSFPTPLDLPNPGIEPMPLASPSMAGRFFTTVPPGKPKCLALKLIVCKNVTFFLPTVLYVDSFTPALHFSSLYQKIE